MATVTGYTAERMKQIEDSTVTDGEVVGNNLILTTRDGTGIDAGSVRGAPGPQGPPGEVTQAQLTAATSPSADASNDLKKGSDGKLFLDQVPVFPDVTARNAAIPSPFVGQQCVVVNVRQTWTGAEWLYAGNPKGGLVVSRNLDYTAAESGDIGATAVGIASLASVPVILGHIYEIKVNFFIIARATIPAGSFAGCSMNLVADKPVANTPIFSSDTVVIGKDIPKDCGFSIHWTPPVSGNVNLNASFARAWWAGSSIPIRYIVSSSYPKGMACVDLGPY